MGSKIYNRKLVKMRDEKGWTDERWAEHVEVDLPIIKEIVSEELVLDQEQYQVMMTLMRREERANMLSFSSPRIIACCNHKGGCGKTTTALGISEQLSEKGYRVLLIDADQQANTTGVFLPGMEDEYKDANLFTAFAVGSDLRGCIYRSPNELDVIPSETRMGSIESLLLSQAGFGNRPEEIFKRMIAPLIEENGYDFIMIDLDMSLSLTNNAILSSCTDCILISQCSNFDINGVISQEAFISEIRNTKNPGLKVLGIVLNKVQSRKKIVKASMDALEELYPGLCFRSYIRQDSNIEAAQWERMTLGDYNRSSNGWNDFKNLTEELLDRIRKEQNNG